MGEVYRVLDLEQGQDCALKILNTMVDQKAVHRRFHREFQMLNRLQHPRLVSTFAWGFAEGRPYFTMEYLPGKTLEKIIADQAHLGQFRASHFFNLIQQIVEGLAYVHAQGAVHRDLKPSNIMVLETEEGIETTILDLGLAKFRHLHSVSITQTGATIGTAEYMSPEQGKGLWVDHRSDLYSLGVILYEMLMGAPPFSGQNPISVIMKHIRESPPSMAEAHVEVPAQTQQIVLKLLAKEPVDRYQSAEEVVQALNGVASSRFMLSDDKQRDVHRKVMRPQFVGRESEMKTLRAMLQDVQAGEQRVVLISGEVGVGKSRLIEELLGDALIHDFLCLKGAGREEGGQIYGALVEAFQRVKTTDLVGRVPDSLETDKFSVMEHWLQLLKRLRQKQPIVLCLEDIQWLDELTLEFLQYVLRDPEPCPFLLCLTYQWSNRESIPEEIENFISSNEFAGATRIQLENLPRKEVGYLAASMLGERSIPSDALQTLFRETGGQPLFVVEAVRTLVNADVIRQNLYGDWQWEEFPETLLSDDISEVLYRRITALPAVQRQVMEYACVFLNDFSFELLAEIWLGDELKLLDVLEDLIEEGLLITYGDEERYRFSQGLYRRAIYDRMQDVRRRLLHREIGNALEESEGAEELTEELSRGIIRRVIETNEPVLSMDAQTDERLNRYQSVIDYNIRSVLCVPVFHLNEGVMGALYVDHRGMGNAFSEADQTFLQAFANLVGVALVNAKMYEQLKERAQYLQQEVERRYQLGDMFGHSDAMQAIYRLIERAAKSDVPVLVQGETGTGKELAARAIHYNSTRKDQRFLSQNCATLSPELLQSELFGHKKGAFTGANEDHIGIFEAANGGTVFLDEIADAPPQLQRSLLRVLQEGEIRRVGETVDHTVDVRIIAATNRDLKEEVENGSFREDLYYRLHVIQIDMPPLREYLEDVPLLAEHLLIRAKEEANKSVGGLTVGAIRALTSYNWPGNVRELENEIRRAVALAEEEGDITPDLFSESIGHTVSDIPVEFQGRLQDHVQEYERRLIRAALEKCDGNITHTARELGMTRVGLHKKINRLGLR